MSEAAKEEPSAERAYRAAGLPWEAKDLRPGVIVSSVKNAAPLLRSAIGLFDSNQFNSAYIAMRKDMDAGSLESVIDGLAPFQKAMDVAVRASDRPDIDFGRDMDKGPAILFPEYAPVKGIAKALCLRAQLDVARHDTTAMARDLGAAWKLGVLMGRDPILIGMLVQIAIQNITLNAIQSCAYNLKKNRVGLEKLMSIIDKAQPPDYGFAMRGEAFMGIATIRNLKAFGGIKGLTAANDGSNIQTDLSHLSRTGMPNDTTTRAFAARHMQVWAEAKTIIDRDQKDAAKLGSDMDQLVMKVEQKKTASNLLNMIMFPVFSQAGVAATSIQAEVIANKAMLTALIAGKLPTSLNDIPGTWTDPYTKKPMLFTNYKDGFRVYSVGPNRKDDGGVFRAENKSGDSNAYDVGASCPPPPRK